MKTKHLEARKQVLVAKREELIGRFNASARSGKSSSRVSAEIRRVNEFIGTLDRIAQENQDSPDDPPRYTVSSLFLHECYRKLTADENEQFFFITGAEVAGVHILDQCAEFTHQRRSRLGVVGEMPATHGLLIKLEQFGHKFLAHFHSHPGKGPDATSPSGTDVEFQRRLESGGHLALMAIFSRDGFVRFVRLDNRFDLEIYGEGVEQYAPGIFRLTNID